MGSVRNKQWEQYDSTARPNGSFMHGTIYIKDLSNNTHYQSFDLNNYGHTGDDPANHVEDALVHMACIYWENRPAKLQSAKVTIAMHDSPCKRCYSRIKAWLERLDKAICGGNGNLFLLFAFKQFYIGNDGKRWEQESVAVTEYEKLVAWGGSAFKATKFLNLQAKLNSRISFLLVDDNGRQVIFVGDKSEIMKPPM